MHRVSKVVLVLSGAVALLGEGVSLGQTYFTYCTVNVRFLIKIFTLHETHTLHTIIEVSRQSQKMLNRCVSD